ncbi:MAG: alpha/beta hydrolase [Erysipelotrichaceae bacterium]|nr:alpha/beta hydrolase [Erysipelotrichaceae bacterium]
MITIEATSKEMKKNSKIVGSATGGFVFKGGYDKVNWKLLRFISNIGYSFMPKEKGVSYKKIELNGIKGIMVTPDNIKDENLIMYIHGGGLVAGSASATKAYCSMIANRAGRRVVTIDYRLAPENVFPAAVDDCETAFLALHEMYPDSKICVTGESGGGYLTFALTVRTIRKNEYVPDCLLPQSPLCDLTGNLDRSYYEIRDNTVKPEGLGPLMDMFAPGVDRKNPELSCAYFDKLDSFPPVMMSCDANETLRADAEMMYEKLKEKGVDCELIMLVNTFHACSTLGNGSPETIQLMEENIRFMERCFSQPDGTR